MPEKSVCGVLNRGYNLCTFAWSKLRRYIKMGLIKSYFHSSGKLYKPSGFSPLVWVMTIVLSFCGYVIVRSEDATLRVIFAILPCLLIVVVLVTYYYLLIRNPKELHSELYLLEDKRLDLMAKQGEEPRVIRINEPTEKAAPLLPDKGGR